MISKALMMVALLAGNAGANPGADLLGKYTSMGFEPGDLKPPRFVLDEKNRASPTWPDVQMSIYGPGIDDKDQLAATTADKSATWVAVNLTWMRSCGGPASGPCGVVDARGHALALFDKDQRPIAWEIVSILPAKQAAKVKSLPAMPDAIDADAASVAKLIQGALPDPAALAKLISERKDAIMFGSDAGERFVGGAAIAKTLASWKLGFTVHDGTQAALSPSKTAAVVAMNVDAKRAGSKQATPYRLFVILEKVDATWKIVALSFDQSPSG
jgi:hypothetical protein